MNCKATCEKLVVHTSSPAETRLWAARLAAYLQAGDFVALCGPLGAGKTCFVQGLGTGLGIEGRITSTTFIIIRHHRGPLPLCHADAYRINSSEELEEAGLLEYLSSSVVAVEWAEQVPEVWPDQSFVVRLSYANEGRRLEVSGRGPRPSRIISELSNAHSGN